MSDDDTPVVPSHARRRTPATTRTTYPTDLSDDVDEANDVESDEFGRRIEELTTTMDDGDEQNVKAFDDFEAGIRSSPHDHPAGASIFEYQQRWSAFFKGAMALDGPFNYFNVHWISIRQNESSSLEQVGLCSAYLPALQNHPKVYRTVRQLALHSWKRFVLKPLRPSLIRAMLSVVQIERSSFVQSLAENPSRQSPPDDPPSPGQEMLGQFAKSLIDVNTPEKDIRSIDSFRHVAAFLAPPPIRPVPSADQLCDYRRMFFEPLLEASTLFYQQQQQQEEGGGGGDCSTAVPIEQLISNCEQRMQFEITYGQRILHTSSLPQYQTQLAQSIVAPNVVRLLDAFPSLLLASAFDYLASLQTLCALLPYTEALAPLVAAFHTFLVNRGSALLRERCVQDAQGRLDPTQCILEILEYHDYCNDFVSRAFHSHQSFGGAIDTAFQFLLNDPSVFDQTQPQNNPAELLARFADLLLRGQAKLPDSPDLCNDQNAIGSYVRKIALLFNFLGNKDTFQATFSKQLARRLIQQLSISHATEQALLATLHDSCGFDFISSAHKMFADVGSATDMNLRFGEWLARREDSSEQQLEDDDDEDVRRTTTAMVPHSASNRNSSLSASQRALGFEFEVLLLTFGSWPVKPGPSLRLPEQLDRCVSTFNTFYATLSNQSKRLSWLHNISFGVLATHYTDRRYVIKLTDFQLTTLLLFNSHNVLTMDELCELTGLAPAHCKQTLYSLVFTKILRKNPPSRTFVGSDKYALNTKFQNKKINLDATKVLARESPKEDAANRQSILEGRRNWAQALLVRLIKAQKRDQTREELVKQVLDYPRSQLAFTPTQPFVSSCIDDLLSNGLIESVEGQPERYRYLCE